MNNNWKENKWINMLVCNNKVREDPSPKKLTLKIILVSMNKLNLFRWE